MDVEFFVGDLDSKPGFIHFYARKFGNLWRWKLEGNELLSVAAMNVWKEVPNFVWDGTPLAAGWVAAVRYVVGRDFSPPLPDGARHFPGFLHDGYWTRALRA